MNKANSTPEKDACETCSYNTNDHVCHPHCGGCNGTSRYKPRPLKFYKTIAVDFDGTLIVGKYLQTFTLTTRQ